MEKPVQEIVQRQTGAYEQKAFVVAAPHVWNSLPVNWRHHGQLTVNC